jgi:hypothetical protein
MDFNAIIDAAMPYILAGSGLTGTGLIAWIISKVVRIIADIRKNANFAELFKAALPKDLTVSVSKLAKSEFDRLVSELKAEFIAPLRELTLLVKDNARALLTLRSVPDDVKNDIASHFDKSPIPPAEVIKLELSKEIIEATKETIPEPPPARFFVE